MTKSRLFLTLALTVAGILLSPYSHAMDEEKAMENSRVKEANAIATAYINILPVEAQSNAGFKDKATLAEPVASGYTAQTERNYEELYKFLEDQEIGLSVDPFLRKEVGLVKSIVADTINLLRLNKQHGRITIYCGGNEAIDPLSYIFENLSSLVIQKYPQTVVGQRFASYVEGDGNHPPFIEGVEQEIRNLVHRYQSQSVLYPCVKQIEEILKEDRLKSILKWIGETIPEEQKNLLPTFEAQIKRYEEFVRQELLPHAPKEAQLPKEIYNVLLKLNGVSDQPEHLIKRGHEDFDALYAEYVQLAKEVAQEEGLDFNDPVKVIQHLEETRNIKSSEEVIALYQKIQGEIEEWIKRDQLMSLPANPLQVRIGTDAEEAIMPVPHVNTPYFVGNDGSVRPEFVLCDLKSHGNPLVAYPLTAHEGHPGHVLQFGRMLEAYLKGELDLIQAIVASNSTNCEGWAHYMEYVMRPYFDKGAQLGAIRDQLLRSARLFLDPELNMGTITFEDVVNFHQEKVGFSKEVAVSEAERYSYRMPGQATTYRHGCLKISDARDQLQRELGDNFSMMKFHDAFISFGLLPVDLTYEDIKELMIRGSHSK